MDLIFLYGHPASGKLTIGRALAERTGYALFHNHLIVDAVGAIFPFGSAEFVRLREAFWLEAIETAARADRSLIFTFAPEPTVSADFPHRVARIVSEAGGRTIFVALTLPAEEQERRLVGADRACFGKLRSVELLRALRPQLDACMKAMPSASIVIETGIMPPGTAAAHIESMIGNKRRQADQDGT